jgi:ribosome biogenesis GTPase
LSSASPSTARVARVDSGFCTLLLDDGSLRAAVPRALSLAVGDWVEFVGGDPPRVVTLRPRTSSFVRAGSGKEAREQVVAANIDTVLLVNGLDVPVNVRRIERALALGWQSGAAPAVVLAKADMADRATLPDVLTAVHNVVLGVPVHVVSADTGEGLDELDAYLQPGRTVALLGPSGAGKSTLVNRLVGQEVMQVGDVRRDGKGRHTTTHRELVPLASGALLLDTPGMRGLGLWDATEGMEKAFADVEELQAACRFGDCSHTAEPGCEVLAAVEQGLLDEGRLDAWRKLQLELRWLARRQDARLRAAEAKRWKAIAKARRDLGPR